MPETKIKITHAKGRPMLNWVGKKPLDYVKGFPAQLIEVFDPMKTGRVVETPSYEELKDNWQNLLFDGDNKDVLATLLELGFRGKIDLIYIDPPFKSGADYVRKVELRGLKNLGEMEEDSASVLQQTMYFDIWNNDTYLQFMYERLMLLKELLAETGGIYVHLNWYAVHYIRLIMDEIFGSDNFVNEIIRGLKPGSTPEKGFGRKHENILFYAKNIKHLNFSLEAVKEKYAPGTLKRLEYKGSRLDYAPERKAKIREEGRNPIDIWDAEEFQEITKDKSLWNRKEFYMLEGTEEEFTGFYTQKPEALLERIIKSSSRPDNIVLDCFVGSGTTVVVAQKLGRRWIGCDINKGAIHLTSRELQKIINEQVNTPSNSPSVKGWQAKPDGVVTDTPLQKGKNETKYPTFAIYKVNNYDLKLLQTEAIELAVQHIGIQRTRTDRFFDGTLGKNLVKIIDFNHPLTLLDLQLIQDELKKRQDEDRDITIVCLGKELAVDPRIEEWNKKHPVNKIKVIELKTDKKYGSFLIHKPAEAEIEIKKINTPSANADTPLQKGNKAIIEIQNFISPTIIERLNIDNKLFKVKIPDFRSMIDCVLIDNNYDDKTFHIIYSDIPEKKNDLVKGKYEIDLPAEASAQAGIPKEKTKVAVKIIDMLGEEILFIKEVWL